MTGEKSRGNPNWVNSAQTLEKDNDYKRLQNKNNKFSSQSFREIDNDYKRDAPTNKYLKN